MIGTSIVLALMVATVLVLLSGLVLMAVGNKTNEKYANKLMTARVILQGLALGMLLLMVAFYKHGS